MYANTHKTFLKETRKTLIDTPAVPPGEGCSLHTGKLCSFPVLCDEYTLIRQFEKKKKEAFVMFTFRAKFPDWFQLVSYQRIKEKLFLDFM